MLKQKSYTEEKFKELAALGENSQIEYKTCRDSISESLYETVCSFLNHTGGVILLGVKDEGTIVGVNPDKAEILKKNIINSINNRELFLPCPYFTPQILQVDGLTVIALDIPSGEYVYRYKGNYWDRNGEADINITDQPELLQSLFERKNPHLFEERIVNNLTMEGLEHETFQYCRNILASLTSGHPWLQMTDDQILISTHLAKKDKETGSLKIKYAALLLFGTDDAIVDFIPRYRFEALFHMCTFDQYNDMAQFPNRYDDRRTMRCNLIKVYRNLSEFTERYLPDKFYLPENTTQRENLRWKLFREIIGNLCVHADFSSGYACFFHVFKDRVVTKNPTRLLPETPEGELTINQLSNYTKNPLLVRAFHELAWVEDLGSGMRNILRYAPLYYPNYKIEINSGSQFLFSITYMDATENVHDENEMSATDPKNVRNKNEMSATDTDNVRNENDNEDFSVIIKDNEKVKNKKNKRIQAIVGLIRLNPSITVDEIAEKLDVNEKTIRRDLKELRDNNIIQREGGNYGGRWVVLK